MDVTVKSLRSFITTRYGSIESGQQFDCPEHLARQWADAGMVEIVGGDYETKVVDQAPRKPRRKKQGKASESDAG